MNERIRWAVITMLAAVAVVTTASLGRWQLTRASEKETLREAIEQRGQDALVDGAALSASDAMETLIHRRARVQGHWIAERTVFLDNRQMKGRQGFFVVTPLQLSGREQVLLVQRGWVPRDFQHRTRVPVVPTPGGLIELEGRIAAAPARLYDLGDEGGGAIRQNLDLPAFGRETGLPLLPASMLQTSAAEDGLLRDWPQVHSGIDKHYGYAFQWFGLSALIASLYVWFQIVKRYTRRKSR